MADNCPQLNLTVPSFPSTEVSCQAAPVLTIDVVQSGNAVLTDGYLNYPQIIVQNPEVPQLQFFAVDGVNPYQLAATGHAIDIKIDLISGYLQGIVTGAVRGVTSLNTLRGAIQITGTGTVVVTNNGQVFIISGTASGDVTQAQLVATGAVLNSKLTGLSGYFETKISNIVAGVSSINLQSGALTITGIDGVTITNIGTAFTISGNAKDLVETGRLLGNRITSLQTSFDAFTGSIMAFTVNVPIGIDTLFVVYPGTFASIPVAGPILSATGLYGYVLNPTNFSSSGFTARFSDIIGEGGVQINTILKAN